MTNIAANVLRFQRTKPTCLFFLDFLEISTWFRALNEYFLWPEIYLSLVTPFEYCTRCKWWWVVVYIYGGILWHVSFSSFLSSIFFVIVILTFKIIVTVSYIHKSNQQTNKEKNKIREWKKNKKKKEEWKHVLCLMYRQIK